MTTRKKILLTASAVFIIMQFFQPEKNNNERITGNDISRVYQVPVNVNAILRNSCYDCHSDSTRYPWYASIQPFAWWMNEHIKEGKSELNFNEFGTYSSRRQKSKIRAIEESVEDGSMPLASYTLIHQSAKLSKDEKRIIKEWLAEIENTRPR
ncbi:heme-binding domain-containing protein [Pedobacter sp. P351]|uniref:heme-binding domain-containing protein n=1 Tax=Pedobacter superstes TaxID=3133441 RepID=UPI0030AEE1A7